MKQDALKSKTDPRKLLVFYFISAFLLITNVTGWNQFLYSTLDTALHPFLIAGRNFAFNTNLLFTEITNKSEVLKENVALKREIASYEQLRAENKDLIDQLERIQAQSDITAAQDTSFQLVKVSGAQNLYTSNPELLIFLGKDTEVNKWDPVYYDRQTLFGFIKEIHGRTATVVPYYSPDIKFNIPVQSLRDTSQKGFVSSIDNAKVKIRNVSKDVGVSVGDVWVTTNDVTEVPSSLVIGKVSNVVKQEQENFQDIEITIGFSLNTTTYLMIPQPNE